LLVDPAQEAMVVDLVVDPGVDLEDMVVEAVDLEVAVMVQVVEAMEAMGEGMLMS